MDTFQTSAIYTLAVLLFLLGAYALLFAWLPVPAKYTGNRMSRGAGARIAGLMFALALPQVVFLAPILGRGDVSVEDEIKHSRAVLELSHEFRRLAEENSQDREDPKELLQRRDQRTAEMQRLSEQLRAMQEEHTTLVTQQEAKRTRFWQWKILAVCFGLGTIIGRYTGSEIPG